MGFAIFLPAAFVQLRHVPADDPGHPGPPLGKVVFSQGRGDGLDVGVKATSGQKRGGDQNLPDPPESDGSQQLLNGPGSEAAPGNQGDEEKTAPDPEYRRRLTWSEELTFRGSNQSAHPADRVADVTVEPIRVADKGVPKQCGQQMLPHRYRPATANSPSISTQPSRRLATMSSDSSTPFQ